MKSILVVLAQQLEGIESVGDTRFSIVCFSVRVSDQDCLRSSGCAVCHIDRVLECAW